MNTRGLDAVNYLGFGDDVMLEPSRRWLEEGGGDEPFQAIYPTATPHHDYVVPDRYDEKRSGMICQTTTRTSCAARTCVLCGP